MKKMNFPVITGKYVSRLIREARMLDSRFLIQTKSPCPPEEVGTGAYKGESLLSTFGITTKEPAFLISGDYPAPKGMCIALCLHTQLHISLENSALSLNFAASKRY